MKFIVCRKIENIKLFLSLCYFLLLALDLGKIVGSYKALEGSTN